MMSNIFTVTTATSIAALQEACSIDSPYARIEFQSGVHSLAATLKVEKPGLVLDFQDGAHMTPTPGLACMFDIKAPNVEVRGSGSFDGGSTTGNTIFRDVFFVRDTADGFWMHGDEKPDPSQQDGALEFTNVRAAVTLDGADNVVVEKIHMHDFWHGTLGIIVRDVGTENGVNAFGAKGSVFRDIYAHGGNGGGVPGNLPANGSWIRMDTDETALGRTGPSLSGITITDNILLGGSGNLGENGRTYFFVNIDSNVDAATDIEIAYNTLANAASYEIQIKNGFLHPVGISDVYVHDNLMDHSSPDLLRVWPLKLQSNHDSPFSTIFENNLALLRGGRGPEDLHFEVGNVENGSYSGDFMTNLFREVIRHRDSSETLQGDSQSEWLLASGASTVVTGAGHDLVEFRPGDGIVRIQDFEAGVDQIRLNGFGNLNPVWDFPALQSGPGVLDFGQGDQLIVEFSGTALDLSGMTSADIIVAQTYHCVLADGVDLDVSGTNNKDKMVGSSSGETLRAGQNDDLLFGRDGNDWLYGESGDDRITSGAGSDRMWGGAGADAFIFEEGSGLNIVYDFELGVDHISLVGVDIAELTFLTYNGRDADIRTQTGDRIVLRDILPEELDSFDFFVHALDTNGTLTGGVGNDNLRGAFLDDRLETSAGQDRLYGYAGADTFVFSSQSNLNIIYDFEVGVDRIDLSGLAADQISVMAYGSSDAELRATDGSRLVLRDVDLSALTASDSLLSVL
ncbi:MAG: hypothetical protein CSA68_10920 [Rhodobacterales bacterium]|nr:MAG: hypothetical protein CSA68_10920 [Rhodobacterales bacterium]